MAEHTIGTDLFYDAAWNDAPVYVRDGVSATRGAGGEGQESPPSTLSMTIDNRTADYSPGNADSPLAGKVGRNTPVRLVVDGSTRTTVEASALAPDQDPGSDPDRWVNLTGGGILRRLQNGKTPLRGPLERAIAAADPFVWWPLMEGTEATALLPATDGAEPLVIDGIRPGIVDGPAGSGVKYPDVAYAGALISARGPIPAGLPATGWGIEFIVFIGRVAGPEVFGDSDVLNWTVSGSDLWTVEVGVDGSTGPYVIVFGDINGTNAGVFRTSIEYGWHHVRVLFQQSGANVLQTLYVDGVNLAGGDSASTAGTLGPPTGDLIVGQVIPTPFTDNLESAAVGQIALYSLAGAVDHSGAAFGYVGELAGERFLRVLGEEGVSAVVVGDELDTQPMGAQPSDTLVNIVRECVRTDAGMLFEPADQIALAMRTGRSLLNQDPVLELSWASPGIAPPLRPRYDDRPTFNDVTVNRRNGGSARAVQTDGPLNVNDPIDDPDGIGRVDTTVEVNTDTDDVLAVHAGWHLSKGTVPDPRYPEIMVDLDDAPGLIAAVNAVDIGDKITLEDLPLDWAREPVPMLVVGIRESLPPGGGHRRRMVTFVTAPAVPYEILQVGDGTVDLRGMRVHTTSSTVDGAHVAADTTILIDSAGITWTTNADNWNPALNGGGMFLEIAGEIVRVTGIAGAGSAWTLTVVRAVNGVSKTLPDGAPVRFRYPGRIAL